MLEYVDAVMVANEISLLRDVYRGAVLLAEGVDDARFFEKFKAREDRCRIIPTHGKTNALRALEVLRERSLARWVLVVVDADYWRLLGNEPEDPDILVTDSHDLEMDIAASDALDDVLRELCDPGRVATFESKCGTSLRDHVLTEAARVGTVRLVSARDDLRLVFSTVDLEDHIDCPAVLVDLPSFVQSVVENTPGYVDAADVLTAANRTRVAAQDLQQVVRGHDYTCLLAVALRSAVGDCSPTIADAAHIEVLLRLAYSRDHFDRTRLFAAILAWEERTGACVLD